MKLLLLIQLSDYVKLINDVSSPEITIFLNILSLIIIYATFPLKKLVEFYIIEVLIIYNFPLLTSMQCLIVFYNLNSIDGILLLTYLK